MKILTDKKFYRLLRKEWIKGFDDGFDEGTDFTKDIFIGKFIEAETPEEFCNWVYYKFIKGEQNENNDR